MIFDGDCGFCRFWIEHWRRWTRAQVEFVPYQDASVAERFPEVSVAACETAVQLVERDGRVLRGAEAVFQSLAGVFILAWLIRIYRAIPSFARLSETAYRFVASHRQLFSRLNRWLWGARSELPRYELTTALLVRALGLIFLTAFVSLWVQIHGLVGEQGILPAGEFMKSAAAYFDQTGIGIGRYARLPTLGWLAAGNGALHIYCLLGVGCSLLVVIGRAPAAALAGCWLFYLTLVGLGQDFLSFQWDVLLLEAGLLVALLAPWCRRLKRASINRPLLGILLARWLLFRLMLESGAVKWLSGDPVWRNFSALQFHFETQPLPHWLSWHAHQLPTWLLKAATLGMFAVELLVPFLIFAPRRLRLFAGVAIATLQVAIITTGNYGCFNWLTLVLCLALLDDRAFRDSKEWLKRKLPALAKSKAGLWAGRTFNQGDETRAADAPPDQPVSTSRLERIRRRVLIAYAVIVVLIGLAQLDNVFGSRSRSGGPVTWLRSKVEPFRVVNTYGLFAVMTTSRPELIIEGSLDGAEWRPYVFKYKPGPLARRPPIVPWHMPRLDWQLWFAALQEGNPPRWLGNFAQRLFERSPEVLGLLAADPFPDQPPRYMRVLAFDYRFSNASMRRNTGHWWIALNRRHYVPVMQWEPPKPAPAKRK